MAHSSTKHNKIKEEKLWGYLFIAPNFYQFLLFLCCFRSSCPYITALRIMT